jgi:ElaB/YqjD/DUF883 family membrane-anchored ribosome-binding protein
MNRNTIEATAPNLEALKDSVQTLIEHGSEAADDIKARVGEVVGEAREKLNDVLDQAESFIGEHPLKAMGMAFGVGYLAMRVRTSPLFPLALVAGVGVLIKQQLDKR